MGMTQSEVYAAAMRQIQEGMSKLLDVKEALRMIPDSGIAAPLMKEWQLLYDTLDEAREQARVSYLATRAG